MTRGQIVVAIVLGALAVACGGADDETQPRRPNTYQTLTPTIAPQTDTNPPPRDMPGGGRGSDPPHTKGKP